MEEKKLFKVTSNPILRTGRGTQQIMLDVIIGLIPALAVGVYMFGAKAAMLLAVSIVSCVFFEWAYKNFLNPALAGRAFLTAAYAGYMTVWAVPSVLSGSVDAATMATPLSYLYAGQPLPEYMGLGSIFLGSIPGCIGEISTLAVLIGGIWLLARKVITWRIPVTFIGSVAVLCLIFGHEGYGRIDWMLLNVCSGGLMLGAFFMATDYSTSPVTLKGQLVFGLGCGVLTVLIRYFGSYPEGVSYAILIMNCCTWGVDKLTRPRQFGVSAEDAKNAKAAKKAAKKQTKEGAANG